MAKKSKSKKSKAKKTKSESRETKPAASDEAVLGRSIDDVYNYLHAINVETLGRIEKDTKAIRDGLTNLGNGLGNQLNVIKNEVIKTQQIATAIETRLKIELPVILTEVKNVFSLVGAMRESVLPRIEAAIAAIKAKTDRLP